MAHVIPYTEFGRYLTGSPVITHFKSIYKRHTDFSRIVLKKKYATKFGDTLDISLFDNKADLLMDIDLRLTLPTLPEGVTWKKNFDKHLITNVKLISNGKILLEYREQLLQLYQKTKVVDDKNIIIRHPYWFNRGLGGPGQQSDIEEVREGEEFPTFDIKCGHGLPLIALHKSDVTLQYEFNSTSNLIEGVSSKYLNNKLDVTAYFERVCLDGDERRRFAQAAHESLITNYKYVSEDIDLKEEYSDYFNFSLLGDSMKHLGNDIFKYSRSFVTPKKFEITKRINIGNPVKTLFWIFQTEDSTDFKSLVSNIKLTPVNVAFHHDIVDADDYYLQHIEPHKIYGKSIKNVYMYSFELNDSTIGSTCQPFGSYSQKDIDLTITFKEPYDKKIKMTMVGLCYNVFRIMGGKGYLAYDEEGNTIPMDEEKEDVLII